MYEGALGLKPGLGLELNLRMLEPSQHQLGLGGTAAPQSVRFAIGCTHLSFAPTAHLQVEVVSPTANVPLPLLQMNLGIPAFLSEMQLLLLTPPQAMIKSALI